MRRHHGTQEQMWTLIQRSVTPGDPCQEHFNQFFGFLFEQGNPALFTEDQLGDLSKTMKEKEKDSAPDLDTPIGFAFFGQFIDHDLTLDVVTSLGQVAGKIEAIENMRTPRLELDSIYLAGPEGSQYLYDKNVHGRILHGTASNPLDLHRNAQETAIIGDSRNDENMFISQLHGLFIRFHNWLIDGGQSFEKARDIVRYTYQKAVVDEFLPAIIDDPILATLISGFNAKSLPNVGTIDWTNVCSMPVEFSAAAYRFGHSHIRQDYRVNDNVVGNLFDFGGFNPVAVGDNVDWKYFFDLDGASFLKARPIDTQLARDLFQLPFAAPGQKNLAGRNLVRGQITFGLLTGEEVATRLGVAPIPTHPEITNLTLPGTPLWFYILAEAELNGGRLGFVGGTIVAGTILNILLKDHESYIHHRPNFDPFDFIPNSNSILASIALAVDTPPA